MSMFSFSARGLHALRTQYIKEIDESFSNDERYGSKGADLRAASRAVAQGKLAEVDAELAARATATHPMSTPNERSEFAAEVRARVEQSPSVCVSVEDAYACPSCDSVVAHPEDHARRCTVTR